ncbi:MAG: HEAT repeat domain-containing protein [Bryobacterales bacterium]|nr:HEAT repeat domain-containing protein [Bryobacterales bacterium]
MEQSALVPYRKEKQQVQAILRQVAAAADLGWASDSEFSILYSLVGAYSAKAVMVRLAMVELLKRNPRRFCAAVLRMLRSDATGPGMDHLVGVFLENNLMICALTDPNLLTEDQALEIAGQLHGIDARLDTKLLNRVMVDESQGARGDSEGIKRALAIIDDISDCTMLAHPLTRLLRHRDGHVRSKAGLLLVRAHRNADWLRQQMATADPRTLANLIEGLLETDPSEREVHLLWTYTYHSNHRVASTALLVLYRNGHQEAKERLLAMGRHPTEQFRTAAAWAMGQTGDPCFLGTLQHMARNDTGNAKRMGLKASVHLRKAAALATPARECAPEGVGER